MANHAYAHFRRKVEAGDLNVLLNAISASRFQGLFKLDLTEEDGFWWWEVTPRPADFPMVPFRYQLHPSRRKLEWRHPTDSLGPEWWVQEFMVSQAITMLGVPCYLTDEGIDERMEPNYFEKFPTYSTWLKGLSSGLIGGAMLGEAAVRGMNPLHRQFFG